MPSREDFEAWKTWRRAPSPNNMQAVLNSLNPLIQKEVNRWSGTLARPLLELEAKRLAAQAVATYRPNAGAALGTHVTNRLKKLSRISYTHQNLARLPEHQTMKFHTYSSAAMDLENKLGREPTDAELAAQLGWSRPFISRFRRSLRNEFLESGTPAPIFDQPSDDSKVVDFVFNDLSPEQQTIFKHTTGYSGAEVMSSPQLMQKMKMTQGQLSYQKRMLRDKIMDATGGGIS